MTSPEKLRAGLYRYRGRYALRTEWGPGPRGGAKLRWEVADDDAYGGITIHGMFTHRTMKEAMTEIDQEADKSGEYKQVPAHIRESTGQFCSGGGLFTANGRCQMGCDHAEHYANDGHPECEDTDLPTGYRWATEVETELIGAGRPIEHMVVPRTVDSTGKPYTQDEADLAVPIDAPLPQRPGEGWCALRDTSRDGHDGSFLHQRTDRCEGFRTTP